MLNILSPLTSSPAAIHAGYSSPSSVSTAHVLSSLALPLPSSPSHGSSYPTTIRSRRMASSPRKSVALSPSPLHLLGGPELSLAGFGEAQSRQRSCEEEGKRGDYSANEQDIRMDEWESAHGESRPRREDGANAGEGVMGHGFSSSLVGASSGTRGSVPPPLNPDVANQLHHQRRAQLGGPPGGGGVNFSHSDPGHGLIASVDHEHLYFPQHHSYAPSLHSYSTASSSACAVPATPSSPYSFPLSGPSNSAEFTPSPYGAHYTHSHQPSSTSFAPSSSLHPFSSRSNDFPTLDSIPPAPRLKRSHSDQPLSSSSSITREPDRRPPPPVPSFYLSTTSETTSAESISPSYLSTSFDSDTYGPGAVDYSKGERGPMTELQAVARAGRGQGYATMVGQGPTGTGTGTGAFVYKVYQMLLDPTSRGLIRFSNDGTTFVVTDPPEFAKEVLPLHFKHSNFSSFVRQLNMYSFRKVNKTPRGQLVKMKELNSPSPSVWEFSHPKFVRGRADLLKEIKRKSNDPEYANGGAKTGRSYSTPAAFNGSGSGGVKYVPSIPSIPQVPRMEGDLNKSPLTEEGSPRDEEARGTPREGGEEDATRDGLPTPTFPSFSAASVGHPSASASPANSTEKERTGEGFPQVVLAGSSIGRQARQQHATGSAPYQPNAPPEYSASFTQVSSHPPPDSSAPLRSSHYPPHSSGVTTPIPVRGRPSLAYPSPSHQLFQGYLPSEDTSMLSPTGTGEGQSMSAKLETMENQLWEVISNLNETRAAYEGVYKELEECKRREEELRSGLERVWDAVAKRGGEDRFSNHGSGVYSEAPLRYSQAGGADPETPLISITTSSSMDHSSLGGGSINPHYTRHDSRAPFTLLSGQPPQSSYRPVEFSPQLPPRYPGIHDPQFQHHPMLGYHSPSISGLASASVSASTPVHPLGPGSDRSSSELAAQGLVGLGVGTRSGYEGFGSAGVDGQHLSESPREIGAFGGMGAREYGGVGSPYGAGENGVSPGLGLAINQSHNH